MVNCSVTDPVFLKIDLSYFSWVSQLSTTCPSTSVFDSFWGVAEGRPYPTHIVYIYLIKIYTYTSCSHTQPSVSPPDVTYPQQRKFSTQYFRGLQPHPGGHSDPFGCVPTYSKYCDPISHCQVLGPVSLIRSPCTLGSVRWPPLRIPVSRIPVPKCLPGDVRPVIRPVTVYEVTRWLHPRDRKSLSVRSSFVPYICTPVPPAVELLLFRSCVFCLISRLLFTSGSGRVRRGLRV